MNTDDKNEQEQDFQNVFSKNAIEFATVAREYCVFAENALKYSKEDYLRVASRLLPLLYMKGALLPDVEQMSDDDLPEIVDYDTYETVRRNVHDRLTSHDDYITAFKEDFQYSETPIAASISEDMADIYQDIRNFCEQYSSGDNVVMNDALAVVEAKFKEYWGQKACNALGAIHKALNSSDDLSDEAPATRQDDQDDETDGDAAPIQEDGMPYFLRQAGMRLVDNKQKR